MENNDQRSPEHLIRSVAHVARALRGWFEAQDFLEIMPPSLESVHKVPFLETLEVDLGEGRVMSRAQLSPGPHGHLEAVMPQVGNVYTIAPAFRGERGPDWLMEFRYIQATGKGDLEHAFKLAEALVTHTAKHLQDVGLPVADQAKRFDAVRVPYHEAVKIVGSRIGEAFNKETYAALSTAHGNRPVFLTGVPLSLEPNAALGARMTTDGPAFFELVLPGVGEVASGKEYETSPQALLKAASNPTLAREAAANWHAPSTWHTHEDLEGAAKLYAQLPSPSYTVTMGFERLTQYVIGAKNIRDAVLYPVTTDARSILARFGGGHA